MDGDDHDANVVVAIIIIVINVAINVVVVVVVVGESGRPLQSHRFGRRSQAMLRKG